MKWSAVKTGPLRLIYPAHCLSCHESLDGVEELVCRVCAEELRDPAQRRCPQCAHPLGPGVTLQSCVPCRQHAFRFDETVAVGPFEDSLRRLVIDAKEGDEVVANWLGGRLVEQIEQAGFASRADTVVCVPSHWLRRWTQFDRVWAMGRIVSPKTGLRLVRRMLRRVKYRPPQPTRSAAQRWQAVRGCFRARGNLKGRTILLLDDVMATGATINECARTLKRAGAARVLVAVVCRSERK